GDGGACVMDTFGGSVRAQLGATIGRPAWSPDAERIVTARRGTSIELVELRGAGEAMPIALPSGAEGEIS
ncbi:MAG: hypothetical protein ACOYN0_19535, partial [Phycisphaerales bacterium]